MEPYGEDTSMIVPSVLIIDVKNVFYFFYFWSLFTFLTFFYFPNVFYFKKTLAKFRAASRLIRSTFAITATK